MQPSGGCPTIQLSSRSELGHPSVSFSQNGCGRDVRNRRLELVLPSTHHIAIAPHHGVETDGARRQRDRLSSTALLAYPACRPARRNQSRWSRASDRSRSHRTLSIGSQRKQERVDERLRAVVDGLVCAWHESRARSREQDAPFPAGAHLAPGELHEVDRASDVGVDDVANITELLVEKRATECPAFASSASTGGPFVAAQRLSTPAMVARSASTTDVSAPRLRNRPAAV
jgi:hypothetical protein